MHPTGLVELAHGGVDDGHAGVAGFPGFEFVARVIPLKGLGFRLEGTVHAYSREVVQDVDVEIPPGDFGDPGSQAFLVAAGALRLSAGYQTLPAREYAVGEVRGYLAGTVDGGEVPLFLVGAAALFQEALKLVVGGVFAGGYEGLGSVPKGFRYGVDLFRFYGVTPGFGSGEKLWMGFVYPAAPTPRKGGEYGIRGILLGEDFAYWCNGLVAVFANSNVEVLKAMLECFVAFALVNAILFVEVQRLYFVLFAVALEFAKAVLKALCVNKGQRYAQFCQFFGQGVGMSNNKLYPGWGPVVFLPLIGGKDKARAYLLVALAGSCEGGVVGNPEIVSEPDQLCHP